MEEIEQALENKSISLHSKIISTYETIDKTGNKVSENIPAQQEDFYWLMYYQKIQI